MTQEELTFSYPSAQINFSVKAVPLGLHEIPVSVLCALAQKVFREGSVFPTTMRDTMVIQGLSGEYYNPDTKIIVIPALTRFLFRNAGEILTFLSH